MDRGRRAFALPLIAALMCSGVCSITPANAAPSGSVVTQEILAGGGAVVYLLKYMSAVKRIKGSANQAQLTVESKDIAAFAYRDIFQRDCVGVSVRPDSNCPNTDATKPRPYTLREIHDQLTKQVAISWSKNELTRTPPTWQKYYNDYNICYNEVMFKPAPAASSSQAPASPTKSPGSGSGDASSKGGASPKPSATPKVQPTPKASATPNVQRTPTPTVSARGAHQRGGVAVAPTHHTSSPAASKIPAPSVSPVSSGPPSGSPSPKSSTGPTPTPSPGCNDLLADYVASGGADFKLASPSPPASVRPSPSPTPRRAGAVPSEPTFTPAPTPTPTPAVKALFPIDALNLSQSLANAPSLLQQVSDENVGSFGADNGVRSAFLIRTGAQLLFSISPNDYPAILRPPGAGAGAGGIGETDYTSVYSDCATASPFSALTCLKTLSGIEQKIETARQQRIACDWAKPLLLPTYSALQMFPNASGAWGAPPGC
jgi:hypothetical protein